MVKQDFLLLPVEIVHRIFDYCDAETLLFSIRCISKYLCAIVEIYDRFALNWRYTSKLDEQYISHLIQPEKVVSLSFFGYEKIQDMLDIDINQFTRLRSLTFIHINGIELDKLFSTMTINSLISMSIDLCHISNVQTLIPSSSQFNNLSLSQFSLPKVNKGIRWIMSPSIDKLKYLQIDICSYNEYVTILYHLPNLRILRIKNFTMNESTLNLNVQFYSSLKSLLITNSLITSVQLESLIITTLKLWCKDLKNDGIRYLADALRHNKTLTVLELGPNDINSKGIEYLANALTENTTLNTLHIFINPIFDVGTKYLALALMQNKVIYF
ncbi:unnamed protein product [Rotaria sp. Silwood2]|nr:unnamed protein product [Rotaria sp. Silwood2]